MPARINTQLEHYTKFTPYMFWEGQAKDPGPCNDRSKSYRLELIVTLVNIHTFSLVYTHGDTVGYIFCCWWLFDWSITLSATTSGSRGRRSIILSSFFPCGSKGKPDNGLVKSMWAFIWLVSRNTVMLCRTSRERIVWNGVAKKRGRRNKIKRLNLAVNVYGRTVNGRTVNRRWNAVVGEGHPLIIVLEPVEGDQRVSVSTYTGHLP